MDEGELLRRGEEVEGGEGVIVGVSGGGEIEGGHYYGLNL